MPQALEAWHQARVHQSSIVSDIFEGQLQSTLTCDTCGTRSHSFEVFQDLSLPIPHTSPSNPSIQAGSRTMMACWDTRLRCKMGSAYTILFVTQA